MLWGISFVVLTLATYGDSITKPVYKIALTQKGYAQFLQYDLETPPLREFTFCVWVQFFHLDNDQSILTYVANGNNRVVRMWLDTGGRNINISINGKVFSGVPVDIGKDSWRHICLSYQSDHGAWALYVDGRLVSCEAAQSLHNRVLPGRGSIIVGYGIISNGIPNGLEGEIFGANMILSSTIERNYTMKSHPEFKQQLFQRNKVMNNNDHKYIVLGDMKNNKLEKMGSPIVAETSTILNASRNYIKVKTPFSFIEHDVGRPLNFSKAKPKDMSSEKEILDFSNSHSIHTTEKDKINFWKIINEAGHIGNFNNSMSTEIYSSGTRSFPKIFEYETPPPIGPIHGYSDNFFLSKKPISLPDIRSHDLPDINQNMEKLIKISDIETPPPPPSKNSKVYGQWTSSKFASSVLNYLKSINFYQREQKKVPLTIPLLKISDSFPYASDITVSKVHPSFKFQRRSFLNKRFDIQKREVKHPQFNVQILEENLRDQILDLHAKTRPKNVEVTNRGEVRRNKEHRFYRNVQGDQSNEESTSTENKNNKLFPVNSNFDTENISPTFKQKKLLTILPFLKTLEYYVDNLKTNKTTHDMYSKSLSKANKWHNVKSYSNDYTPRQLNINPEFKNQVQEEIAQVNTKYPSIRLKYRPDRHKVEPIDDARIIEGRNLAAEISNPSNHNVDATSLIKFNHGFLSGSDSKTTSLYKSDKTLKDTTNIKENSNRNNFNKHVKLGNALNEQTVIGHNEEQQKQSFVGGDELIPDVNRYRSDIDSEGGGAPASLGPKVCKNVELYDRLFYVQLDGSIDVTHILSPVKETNIAIEFILQSYKKCSLDNSALENNYLVFIDWNKTPVRLFGGAYPKRTTDLCGFF